MEHDEPTTPGPAGEAPGAGDAATSSTTAATRRPAARLERSVDDRMIAGVCGGLGRHFGVDPVIFRVVAVVLVFAGGSGLLLYGLAWALVPEQGHRRSLAEATLARNGVRADGRLVGAALLVLAALLIAGSGEAVAAVILAVAAVLLLQRRSTGADPPPDPPPPAAGATPAPPPAGGAPTEPPPAPPSVLGRVVLSLLLVLAGLALTVDLAGIADVSVEGSLSVALILVGAGLVVGAWYGRARGLIALGIILTVVLALTSLVSFPGGGGIGERRWRPASVDELPERYRLLTGDAILDLTALDLPAGTTTVDVHVGAGQLRVLVPGDADVLVDAEVGIGQVDAFGVVEGGTRVERRTRSRPAAGELDGGGTGRLRIRARVGFGELEVDRVAA